MKYVFQFGRILLFCFLGELLHMILPLPIPASIYGLILLLVALLTGIVKLEQVQDTGKYLVAVFPIMFVPAAAGVMNLWEEISAMLIPIILATVVVTALVIGAAGKVTELMIRRTTGGEVSVVAGGSTELEKMCVKTEAKAAGRVAAGAEAEVKKIVAEAEAKEASRAVAAGTEAEVKKIVAEAEAKVACSDLAGNNGNGGADHE